MKRVLVRLFPELHINEHRESDGYSRRSRNDHTGPSSACQRREQTSYPRRHRSALATGHEWADTDSVDDETDVNSADLQGFVRSELEALSAGIDDFPSDLSSVFTQEESSKLENAAMDLFSVPEALVTIRAARDKMKGKSEGKGESAKHLQDKLAARQSKSTCHECGQRGHWAGDPLCPGNRNTNFTTWPDDQSFPDREDSRTIMVVERIGQFGAYPQCSNLREHSVCTNSVSNFRCSSVDVHIPVSPVVTGKDHPTRSADSQEFCRSVMENSEPSASRSDLGLGIIHTACLFCVAGSDWWANYKSLLEDFGLKHEIYETREAERYKFGDDQSNSSHFCCWQEGPNCFQRGSFETPDLVDWSRFPDSCQSCCGYGREDAQDWNWRQWFGREQSWTPGATIESARLAQRSEFDRGYSSASSCEAEETGPSDRETAPINCDSFDQFTLSFRSECAKILQIVSEICRSITTSR